MDIASPALTSCQLVAGRILETSADSPFQYFSVLPLVLLVKLALTVIAHQLRLSGATRNQFSMPKKVSLLLNKHQIRAHSVVCTKAQSFEAYVAGIVQPKIVLSDTLVRRLSIKQLEAVLLHEFYHLQKLHPAILMLSSACSSVCWFLPIVKDFSEYIQDWCELAADQYASKTQQTSRYLLRALRTCLLFSDQPTPALAIAPAFAAHQLKKRITVLQHHSLPKNRSHLRFRSISISAAVVLIVAIAALVRPSLTLADSRPESCSFSECLSQCVSERLANQQLFSPALYSPATVE